MWLSAVQLGNAVPAFRSEALDIRLAPDKK